jgi:hypothetical protein
MGGAMLLTFYKGPEFKLLHRLPHPKLGHISEAHHSHPPSTSHQIVGSFLGIISCFSYATWLVIQVSRLTLYGVPVMQPPGWGNVHVAIFMFVTCRRKWVKFIRATTRLLQLCVSSGQFSRL